MPLHAFGTRCDGRTVDRIELTHGPLAVSVLTLGAILQDVRLEGGTGLTAGSDDLSAYAEGPLSYAGALVGPVANRIGGATAPLEAAQLRFEANAAGGHHLHGGASGLHSQIWDIEDLGADHVTLALALPHGLGGYPGDRCVKARYVLASGRLSLTITAETTAPTLWAPANHSYWTLGGGVDGTELSIEAAQYLPTDATVLPTGEVAPVADTRFDFRTARSLTATDQLDTCFCLSDRDQPMRPVARLASDGIAMEMATTAPGLQVFTADPFAAPGVPGHDGRLYGPRFGVALEAQAWPDAPNQARFPSVELAPGQQAMQTTEWRFRRL